MTKTKRNERPAFKIKPRLYTAVYTTSIGHYGGLIVSTIRCEVKPGETIMAAINRAGHAQQKKAGADLYDIADGVTHVFEGWPNDAFELPDNAPSLT